ncbi:MAG: nitronate monooxygenase [Gammaproteobacteria bacterium]|jgi:nitronate monooxygenase
MNIFKTAICDLFGIEVPVVQAPMAGACDSRMAVAVSLAGGLGSLPCAMLSPVKITEEMDAFRNASSHPVNLNFFCHPKPVFDETDHQRWIGALKSYFDEMGVSTEKISTVLEDRSFNEACCEVVEQTKPEVISFHFGLPEESLLTRVKQAGCKVISSATSVREARWLVDHGCDAIIAQGYEAGGHRGIFLNERYASQSGIMALLPQVVDAVNVPVIAAGGIADGRGIAAAMILGASGVQIGTGYLLCAESIISDLHREALRHVADDDTVLTNVFSGRPARGILNRLILEQGPLSNKTNAFPYPANILSPLRAKAESEGSIDFTSLWSGQAGSLCREIGAGKLTRELVAEAKAILNQD